MWNYVSQSEMELYHHGILGMHWGKKNGPPYPLGAGDHSASEKKAGWRKSLKEKKRVAKEYTKEINRLSSQQADAGANAAHTYNKAANSKEKYDREVRKHGENSSKARQLKREFDEQAKATNQYLEDRQRIQGEIDSILKDLAEDGYSTYAAQNTYAINRGRNMAAYILSAGLIGKGTTYLIDKNDYVVRYEEKDKRK